MTSPEPARRGRLIVLSGPSGVGKSTVVRALRERRPFHFSVSATTRPARPHERDGVQYHFFDRPGFRHLIDQHRLLEWAEYNGHLYGTPREPVQIALDEGDDVLLDIEVQGAMQVRDVMPEAVLIFLLPPSDEELEARLRNRGDTTPDDVARRLEIAREEMEWAERFDHQVVNDDVERAVDEILRILDRPKEAVSP